MQNISEKMNMNVTVALAATEQAACGRRCINNIHVKVKKQEDVVQIIHSKSTPHVKWHLSEPAWSHTTEVLLQKACMEHYMI